MKHLLQSDLMAVSGGEESIFFFPDSHGQVDLGITINNNQPAGLLTAESSLCDHAQIKTELSLNSEGSLSGYVGLHATW